MPVGGGFQGIVLKSAQGTIPDDLAKEQIEELQQKILDKEASRPQGQPSPTKANVIIGFFFRFLTRPGTAWHESELIDKKHLQRFYWPTGLTYLGDGHFRTGSEDPFTGLQSGLRRDLSHRAEGVGVEPTEILQPHRISNAAH